MQKEEKLFEDVTYLADDVLGLHEICVESDEQGNFSIDLDEEAEILAGCPKMSDIGKSKMFDKILNA